MAMTVSWGGGCGRKKKKDPVPRGWERGKKDEVDRSFLLIWKRVEGSESTETSGWIFWWQWRKGSGAKARTHINNLSISHIKILYNTRTGSRLNYVTYYLDRKTWNSAMATVYSGILDQDRWHAWMHAWMHEKSPRKHNFILSLLYILCLLCLISVHGARTISYWSIHTLALLFPWIWMLLDLYLIHRHKHLPNDAFLSNHDQPPRHLIRNPPLDSSLSFSPFIRGYLPALLLVPVLTLLRPFSI